jgi:hypothetical protein
LEKFLSCATASRQTRPTPDAFGAALPLRYPGEIGGEKGQSHRSPCQRERLIAHYLPTLSLARAVDPLVYDIRG